MIRFCLFFYFLFFSGSILFSQTPTEALLQKIAFGSCNHQNRPQPLWETIVSEKPDLWIWTGDIIYADTQDMVQMQKMYTQQKKHPGYQKLIQTCPIIGIWDDHDYGKNNAGKEYPQKINSQKLLLEFLDEPLKSARYTQEGVYTSYLFGPLGKQVKIFLLDVRYHRDAPGKTSDPLGSAQWLWLEKELRESSAQIHLIISGIQVLPIDHRYEKWENFPQARTRLFELLARLQIKGVLFISGDRHIAEISKTTETALEYPVYEITSSGMTHSWSDFVSEKNRYRVGEVFAQLHFGMLEIHWEKTPVEISLQIRDQKNQIQLQEKTTLAELSSAK